ncbi:MAG TPA: CCA tRNA nucleotidyltransferase [Acidobacteriaceae bacterium]|nr:CCA tRNA nucleotidyltransferase [Acidobacteriaceae bacterium]
MPDYIQLLESKLSPNQKQALNAMTDVARARGITLFLTGGAVRDIISGASIRDLDITVQANPLKFKKDLEKAGFAITGEHEPSQTLYLRYNMQARMEISASRTEKFPKPARPVYEPAAILDDLHRRDFTANAMALSLNEGSWGLLLDPLNGSADIAARQLRLVSNYGFLEDPIRTVRAVRLMSRTGWEMDERTLARYENAKSEGVISAISPFQRGYELEELAYEEDPAQAMRVLESHGWMEHLTPDWSSAAIDTVGLERLHERLVQLLMAGLRPDPSAAQFRLITAKLSPTQLAALKKLFVRKDLLQQAEALDADAKHLLQQISGKDASKASQLWKLMHATKQEAVLWLFFTGKGATVQNRFENFFAKWPEARQKIPNVLLQEMRITPEVEGYAELLDKLTFAFMDGELPNDDAVRRFAEPYSPPAPPPPVIVRRNRAVKRIVEPKGGKGKGKKSKIAADATNELSPAAAAAEDSAALPDGEQVSVGPPAKNLATVAAGRTRGRAVENAPAKGSAPAKKKSALPAKEKSAAASKGATAYAAKEIKAKPVSTSSSAGGRTSSTSKSSRKGTEHAASSRTEASGKKENKQALKSAAAAKKLKSLHGKAAASSSRSTASAKSKPAARRTGGETKAAPKPTAKATAAGDKKKSDAKHGAKQKQAHSKAEAKKKKPRK